MICPENLPAVVNCPIKTLLVALGPCNGVVKLVSAPSLTTISLPARFKSSKMTRSVGIDPTDVQVVVVDPGIFPSLRLIGMPAAGSSFCNNPSMFGKAGAPPFVSSGLSTPLLVVAGLPVVNQESRETVFSSMLLVLIR